MKDFLSNDFANQSLAQAIEEMKSIQGNDFSIDNINLILSILVYTLFSRMFDLMQPPAVKHSIAVV